MTENQPINIGIIGAGYMGKAHSVAMAAVGAVFDTRLRPVLEMICTTTPEGAAKRAQEFGFNRHTHNWQELVNDPQVDAIIIATPPETHFEIAKAAISLGKPILCEKPLAASVEQGDEMMRLAEAANVPNMTGFNYVRTPATQLAREIIDAGEIGEITQFRGEHTEDFFADPMLPANWRSKGRENGAMGDLAPHMVNCALALAGEITELVADIQTLIKERPDPENPEQLMAVENDDFGHLLCRFGNGASGHLLFSRVAHGRKMGYIYEITGTKGALRFNQEDQNSLWLYNASDRASRAGFKQILTGPEHPDYVNFCLGPGHGTGYQDQIIIEARDFLESIETGQSKFPTFRDGQAVAKVLDAAYQSDQNKCWVSVEYPE